MSPHDIAIPAGVPTQVIAMRRGAVDDLPDVLQRIGIAQGTHALLIEDDNTSAAAGAVARQRLTHAGFLPVCETLKPDAHGHVPGDREQVDQLVHAVNTHPGIGVIVGVGSGVINDLGKLTARLTNKPYVSVATAASMNGYGSPIAAIVEDGVKKTLPAAPTQAIVVDLDVVAAAPIEMTRSGFADLLSKASSNTDWLMAHLVRGDAYDPRPHDILEPVVRSCHARAAAIGRAEPDALALLMHGLIFGGFAMTLAGHSSPASGGEHLLSHYWDMQAHERHAKHYLHGNQVAFGTRVCCALYERLLALDADRIEVDALAARWQSWEQREPQLREAHGDLFAAAVSEAKKQQQTREQYAAELAHLKSIWPDLVAKLKPMTVPAATIKALHEAAGVPTDPAAVGQSRASIRHTMLHAADIRARFTVLDLARSLGVLEPWADDILDACDL